MEQNAYAVTGPQPTYRARHRGLVGHDGSATRLRLRDGSASERLIRLSDLVPFVPPQIWRQNPDEAMLMISDYLAMLRGDAQPSGGLAVAERASVAG